MTIDQRRTLLDNARRERRERESWRRAIPDKLPSAVDEWGRPVTKGGDMARKWDLETIDKMS